MITTKSKVFFITFLFLPIVLLAQNHAQYKNKTNEQLSGLRRGQTQIDWNAFINNFFGPLNSTIQRQFKSIYIAGYDYPDLETALSNANSDTIFVAVVDRQAIASTSQYNTPNSSAIFVDYGGIISTTYKFIIDIPFVCGSYKAFDGNQDSIIFDIGSVDYINSAWFTGFPTGDSVDYYQELQSAINVLEASIAYGNYDLELRVPPGVYYLSDTLIIRNHGVKIYFEDAILKPYGTFTGPLVAVIGDQASRTSRIPENWHRARVDIKNLYIDGVNKSRGIYVNDVMHGKFDNFHFERISGYAVKLDEHKESVWVNLNIQTSNAGPDSALLWIGGETGLEDGSNALVFIGTKITYCGGRYLYIGNTSSIKPRLINFYSPQFHHLDVDAANQNPNVSIDSTGNENVIFIENGENIHFFGGLIRMPAAPNGDIVKLGSVGNTPIKVTFTKTKISSDADGVTGINAISSGRITLSDVHFVLNGIGAKPYNTSQVWSDELNNPHVYKFDETITTDQPGILVVNVASQSDYGSVNTAKDTFSVALDVETLSEPAIIFYSSKGAKATISTNSTDNRLKFFDADFFEFDSTLVTKSGLGVGSGNLGGGDNVISLTNGIPPTTNISNGVLIYPEDINLSSELKVRDESGEITILTENGSATFEATAVSDTVLLPGVTLSSLFIVSPKTSSPTSSDVLSWSVNTDTLFVYRSGTTSGALTYTWMRLK